MINLKDLSTQQIGAIGENAVIVQLLLQGWDAANANTFVKNCASLDLFCRNPHTNVVVPVQVKVGTSDNIDIGCNIGQTQDGSFDKKVCGPWVFVRLGELMGKPTFRFFILSASEIRELARRSQHWYINAFRRTRPINLTNRASVLVPWLEGLGVDAGTKYAFGWDSPLSASSENAWYKIWEE
ncbi:MAG: hypothetical protein HDS11_00385 [Bacteroides sp.]|nr:hypothetical protein [Bacteroides sp.]